jgi:hypothetical protein
LSFERTDVGAGGKGTTTGPPHRDARDVIPLVEAVERIGHRAPPLEVEHVVALRRVETDGRDRYVDLDVDALTHR